MTNPDGDYEDIGEVASPDELLERFEDTWQGGVAPDIGQFLAEASGEPQQARRSRSVELVAIDLEYRWKFRAEGRRLSRDGTGDEETALSASLTECPRLEDYAAAFPDLGTLADFETELILEEYRVRHLFGDRPNHDEFRKRFGRNRPELADALADVDRELQVEGLACERQSVSGEIPTPLSLDDFISRLEDSGVMPADEVRSLLSGVSAGQKPQDGAECASLLVNEKKLTEYQARVILQGEGEPLVLGRHVILDKIGQGGMGVVLKAWHARMERVDALKILSPKVTKTPELLDRFHREVKAAARLEHPNIVAAYDADEVDGTHFLVMQHVDGTNLLSLVKSRGPLPANEAVDCILQAARGLQYAHDQGVVHRDIKPSNLMVDRRGSVKILDMGLARLESATASGQTDLTGTGQIMGTVDYIAPEQAENTKHADQRADIYSLGITLWYLLTGRTAYQGETVMEKLLAHRENPIPSLRQACPQASSELESVFAKMVAKTPDTRYQTMMEVIVDLDRCQFDQPVTSSADTSTTGDSANGASQPDAESAGGLVVATQTASKAADGSSGPEPTATLQSEQLDTDPAAQQSLAGPEADRTTTPTRNACEEAGGIRRPPSRFAWVLGGGGALLLLLAAIVFFLSTRDGVIRVEINDPNIEVSIKGKEIVLRQTDQDKDIRVSPGDHTLIVARGGFEFETDKLSIKRGKTVTVRVELLAGQIQVWQGAALIQREKLPPPKSGEPGSIAPTVSENWQPGPAENVLPGLIARPAERPGIGRWQLETTHPRSEILSLAWSPDGRYLALGTEIGLVRIYDGETRKLVRLLVGHTEAVNAVAWKHDGRQLASASHDGSVHVWNADGELVRVFRHKKETGQVYSVAWHPDGKRLAWGENYGIRISAVDGTPGPLLRDYNAAVRSVAWSPDGQQLASGGDDKTVRLWDTDGTPGLVFEGHEETVNCVAWHPDGQQLASASNDFTARLWNMDGTEGPVLAEGWTYVKSLAWSPDGEKILVTQQPDMWVCSKDGTSKDVVNIGQGISCLAWHPDGDWFVAAGERGRVDTLDVDGEPEAFIRGQTSGWGYVAWSPDGETLAATNGWRLWQWSRDGELDTQFKAGHYAIKHPDWHPNGDRIAISEVDGSFHVWSVDGKGKPLFSAMGDLPRWSPDGRRLAVITSKGIELRCEDGTEAMSFEGSSDIKINAIVWSPDGQWLAAGGDDGKIRLWSQEGKLQFVADDHEKYICWLAWSHDSRWLASASYDGTVRMRTSDGTLGPVLENHPHAVNSVAWSPDDKRLAATQANAVGLWGADGTQGPVLQGHQTLVQSVDFHPKTGTVASFADNTVRLWDGTTGEPEKTIVLLGDGRSATFSAAGQMLDGDAAALENDFVYCVDQPDGRMELRKRLEEPAQSPPVETESVAPTALETWQPGPAEDVLPGLIARPAKLPGIERWQVDTVAPRGAVYSVSYSPDGQRLVCGSHDDNHVRIFDVQSGDLVRMFGMKRVGGNHYTKCDSVVVAWCPNGKRLLGGADGPYGGLHIWDTSSGELLRLITELAGSGFRSAWSPNGNYIATARDRRLIVLDPMSGQRPFESKTRDFPPGSVAWSPDGERLVSVGHDETARVWSIHEDAPIITLEGHQRRLRCVAWSSAGGKIACGGEQGEVIAWDVESGEYDLTEPSSGVINAITWSPDGQQIACAGQGGIKVWRAANGAPGPQVGPGGDYTALAWRPDGRQIAAAGGHPNRVRLWNAKTGALEREIDGPPTCRCVAWSPDGRHLAVGIGKKVRLVEGTTGLPTAVLGGHGRRICALAWNADGSRLASAGDGEGTMRIWNPRTATLVQAAKIPGHVRAIAWDPKANELLAVGTPGVLSWREPGEVEVRIGGKDGGRSISCSSDGRWIATVHGGLRVYHAADGTDGPSVSEQQGHLEHVAFSPDACKLALSYHTPGLDVVRISDLHSESGEAIASWEPQFYGIQSMCWSPDGRWLTVGESRSTTPKLWDVHAEEPGPIFPGGATGTGCAIAWHPDGSHIATANGDGTLRVWDVDSQELQWTAIALSEDSATVFSPAGELIHADSGAEQELVYLVEKPDGIVELLSPSKFADMIRSAPASPN